MGYIVKKNNKEGSYIIEALVSVSLLVVGLVGIFGLIVRSTNMNKDVQNRVVATYLAAEGIEVIKNIVDANVEAYNKNRTPVWNDKLGEGTYEVQFNTLSTTLVNLGGASSTRTLSLDKDSGFYSYASGLPTPYFRTIRIEEQGAEKIRVGATVEWTTEGKKYSVFLQDIFSNWRDRNTPVYTL